MGIGELKKEYAIMKTTLQRAAGVLSAVLLLLASCSKSDEGNPENPNEAVADPAGTVTLSMRNGNNGSTRLGNTGIYIDKADNFTGGYFVSLGAMRGLGNVTRIPDSGWTDQVAVVPGEGYVAYSSSNDQFYRLYVKEYTVNIANEVIGAEVKYQTPFTGSSSTMKLTEDRVVLPATGGRSYVTLETEGSVEPMSISCDVCVIGKYRLANGTFAPNSFYVSARANQTTQPIEGTIEIRLSGGDILELPVVIEGQEPIPPTLEWQLYGSSTQEKDARSQQFAANLFVTNATPEEVEFSTNLPDCKIEQTGYDDRYHRFDLLVTLGENLTGGSRRVVLTARMKDGSVSSDAEFTQQSHTFHLSAELVNFDRQQGSYTVSVETTASDFTAESSDETWCTISTTPSAVVVRAAANATSKDRTATVRVTLNDGQTRDIEVRQGRYAVGDYYAVEGVTGVVFWVEGLRWKIVSMDETQAAWSLEEVPTGTTDRADGAKNQAIIEAIPGWEELYPAFAWCAAKDGAGEAGWYLPARDEFAHINTEQNTVNETLVANGGTEVNFSGEGYWTSNESASNRAYYYYAGYTYAGKTSVKKVRAVCAF